jgi:ketosteroid isomerase-like protein
MLRRLSLANLAIKLTPIAISFVLLLFVTARSQQTSPKEGELSTIISSLDHDFFEAYNKCELSKIESMFTSDIEFYHEKRGQLTGRQSVMEAFSKNLCADKGNRVRRELVEGSLQVYRIDNYGALAVGEHRFYLTQPGQKEKLDGIGRFANLWQLKDGEWRMSRVFSYGFRSP